MLLAFEDAKRVNCKKLVLESGGGVMNGHSSVNVQFSPSNCDDIHLSGDDAGFTS